MILEYKKGSGVRVSDHLLSTHFDCHCDSPLCDYTLIDTDLLDGLEELWNNVGELIIVSGFRCSSHNKAEGGKRGSFHLLGKAADISNEIFPEEALFTIAENIPVFNRGGMAHGRGFLHVDSRGYRARWTYP